MHLSNGKQTNDCIAPSILRYTYSQFTEFCMLGLGLRPITICGSLAASLPVSPSLSVHQLLPRSLAAKPFPSFDPKGVSRYVTELATACPLNPSHLDFEVIRSLFSRVGICGRINKSISGGQVRVEVLSSSFPVSLQLSLVMVAAEFVSSRLNAIDMR